MKRMDEIREMTIIVPESVTTERIDRFLADHPDLDLTRNRIQKLIKQREITVNGEVVPKRHEIAAGDTIAIRILPPLPRAVAAEDIPLEIVYEDEHLVIVNKKPGMVVHPAAGNRTGTLVNALVYRYGKLAGGSAMERPGIVHRLDKETSGLLVVARHDEAYLKLQKLLQAREIKRTYLALVCGHMKEEAGTIEAPIGRSPHNRKLRRVDGENPQDAVTHYRLLRRYRSYDLLEVRLETGRTHQIRVHVASLGHPVLGDADYGGREKWHKGMFGPERPLGKRLLEVLGRQALHAHRLEFTHPFSGERVVFSAEPPADFRTVLSILDEEGT